MYVKQQKQIYPTQSEEFKMTQFKTFSKEFTTNELLVNSLSNNPLVKTGNDLLNYIDGMLFWNYVTLQYNYKTSETSHVYSMGNFIEMEDLFVPVNKVAQEE